VVDGCLNLDAARTAVEPSAWSQSRRLLHVHGIGGEHVSMEDFTLRPGWLLSGR
jgi:hypothetical protein